MMKHLFWYPWLAGALILGILCCLAAMAYLLFFQASPSALHEGAQLVMEAAHAAAL